VLIYNILQLAKNILSFAFFAFFTLKNKKPQLFTVEVKKKRKKKNY